MKPGTYVVVCARDSACHAGEFVSRENRVVVLNNARRLNNWVTEGYGSADFLAEYGPINEDSNIGVPIAQVEVLDASTVYVTSAKAEKALREYGR